MAESFSEYLEPVEVVIHPETGLPHLRYAGRGETVTAAPGSADGTYGPVEVDDLGPVARAWYRHSARNPEWPEEAR